MPMMKKHLLMNWFNRYFADPQAFILLFLLLIAFGLVFFLGNTLAPVFAGIVIAYLLDGVVERLCRWKLPRTLVVCVVFILFMALFLLVIIGLLPLLIRQLTQLLHDLPSMLRLAQAELVKLPERFPEIITEDQVRSLINAVGAGLAQAGQSILGFSLASLKSLVTIIVYIVLVPLLVFFFLKDKFKITSWMKSLLPDNLALTTKVWVEVNQQISNYVRGKVWEILILWGITYIVFRLMGLKLALLVSFITGISVIVPYVCVTVVYIPVGLIAYFQWGFNPETLYILIAYSIIQIFDGNLLAPVLFSEAVNIHPIAIIVAVLVFGSIWGLWGLFFAIPLATLFQAVMRIFIYSNEVMPTKDSSI